MTLAAEVIFLKHGNWILFGWRCLAGKICNAIDSAHIVHQKITSVFKYILGKTSILYPYLMQKREYALAGTVKEGNSSRKARKGENV